MQTENVQNRGTILTCFSSTPRCAVKSVNCQEPWNEEIAQLAVSNGWMEEEWLVYCFKIYIFLNNIICYITYVFEDRGYIAPSRVILGCGMSFYLI